MENVQLHLIDGVLYTPQGEVINAETALGGEILTAEEEKDEDAQFLSGLLKEFGLEAALPYLKDAKVTYRSLKYMDREDIKEAIPPLGLRMEFRSKLLAWKKLQFGIEDDSLPSSVVSTAEESFIATPSSSKSSSPLPGQTWHCLNKELEVLLKETSKGRSILNVYAKNNCLTKDLRDDLINIIIEEVLLLGVHLKAHDFPKIIKEIFCLFPKENAAQEYYFIPRKGKNNPKGKLYSKYVNSKAKKQKIEKNLPNEPLAERPTTSSAAKPLIDIPEIDSCVASALKEMLSRSSSNWSEVCQNWKKTFKIRNNDLNKLSNVEFLKAWPKYADSRCPDLIQIDFNILYPDKDKLLYSKWNGFKLKIRKLYERDLHNEFCKQLFTLAKATTNKDSEDYILATLLNGILPCPARYVNSAGKCNKKPTIADAQESFVVRITCINDYERRIDEIVTKYFSIGLTIQPFLIVEGTSDDNVTGFYIYFDKSLYKFPSFLESLDICFKLFTTLNLKYPSASAITWNFIQQYFFDIHTVFDYKSANLVSVIDFMNNQ